MSKPIYCDTCVVYCVFCFMSLLNFVFGKFANVHRYWCSYGPKDNRNAPKPSQRRKRYVHKRGCQCHFIIKEIVGRPRDAIITYNMDTHEDKNGWPCHGKIDRSADPRAMYAPRISREMVLSVEALYDMGLSIDMVCERHMLEVREGRFNMDSKSDRDSFLTRRDVMNIFNRLAKSKFQLNKNDSISVNLWYQQEQKSFFFYQRPQGDDIPFIIGIQTEWMLRKMVKYSHNSIIAMDSTFSTNKYGVSIYLIIDTYVYALYFYFLFNHL